VRSATRFDAGKEDLDSVAVLDVPAVVHDVQVVHAPTATADVPVAEIPAQDLGVRGTVELGVVTPRAGHRRVRQSAG